MNPQVIRESFHMAIKSRDESIACSDEWPLTNQGVVIAEGGVEITRPNEIKPRT